MVARQCGCTSGDLGKLTIPPQSTFWTILLLEGLLGDYLLEAASAAEGTAAVRFLFHLPPPLLTIPRTGIDIVQLSRLHFWQASYSSSRQLTPVCYNQVQGMLLRGLAPFSLPDWFPLRRHDRPAGVHSLAAPTPPCLPCFFRRLTSGSGHPPPGPWPASHLLTELLQAALPGGSAERLL